MSACISRSPEGRSGRAHAPTWSHMRSTQAHQSKGLPVTLSLCNLALLGQHSIWGASGSNTLKSRQIQANQMPGYIQHPVTSKGSTEGLEDNVLCGWNMLVRSKTFRKNGTASSTSTNSQLEHNSTLENTSPGDIHTSLFTAG